MYGFNTEVDTINEKLSDIDDTFKQKELTLEEIKTLTAIKNAFLDRLKKVHTTLQLQGESGMKIKDVYYISLLNTKVGSLVILIFLVNIQPKFCN
ncbi:MAG: hypothetical protein HW390_2693 [Candidatus Brocadiaceae bacterium]|nr:hypothetical protein [Candidatus Brocadiaceae bacterium]